MSSYADDGSRISLGHDPDGGLASGFASCQRQSGQTFMGNAAGADSGKQEHVWRRTFSPALPPSLSAHICQDLQRNQPGMWGDTFIMLEGHMEK